MYINLIVPIIVPWPATSTSLGFLKRGRFGYGTPFYWSARRCSYHCIHHTCVQTSYLSLYSFRMYDDRSSVMSQSHTATGWSASLMQTRISERAKLLCAVELPRRESLDSRTIVVRNCLALSMQNLTSSEDVSRDIAGRNHILDLTNILVQSPCMSL